MINPEMNEQKLTGMMGLALRARQAVTGTDACRMMIEAGKCGILLMDESTGINTRKKMENLCERTRTQFAVIPVGLMESATGYQGVLMAIRKGSFADQAAVCL